MKKVVNLSTSALTVIVLGVSMLASNASMAAEAKPCKQDVATYCKDVKAGGGRINQCLKSHMKELSATCKASLEEHKTKKSGVK